MQLGWFDIISKIISTDSLFSMPTVTFLPSSISNLKLQSIGMVEEAIVVAYNITKNIIYLLNLLVDYRLNNLDCLNIYI